MIPSIFFLGAIFILLLIVCWHDVHRDANRSNMRNIDKSVDKLRRIIDGRH
jgi:hypothetical protein